MAYRGNNNKGGRPRASHTILSEKMRGRFIKIVNKNFNPIMDSMMDLATGLPVREIVTIGKKTYPRFYVKNPDTNAAKYVLDQSLGRAKESIEHSGGIKTFAEVITELNKE